MDVINHEEEAMMAAMGVSSFGSTKVGLCQALFFCAITIILSQGKKVVGNQEGAANIKKIRTWRQYMNRCALSLSIRLTNDLMSSSSSPRRGGFNR